MRQLDDTDPRTMGPFTLLGRLGSGGMGTVYLGRSPGRTVAVKVVRADLAADDTFRKRFRREVEAARRVSGAFTAQVVDADTEADVPWLATTFVPGISLRDVVARHGTLPEETLRTLLSGIAEALVHVHAAGLVHRDLSPANVLLAPDGPHVIDFGISRPADEAATAAGGAFVGSAPYLSPEQALGEPVLTAASDVFSLASTIAYAALGRHLFGEGHPVAVAFRVASKQPDLGGIPDSVRPLLERCLAKEPRSRPEPADLVTPDEAAPADHSPSSGSWLPAPIAAEIIAVRRVMTELQEAQDGPRAPEAEEEEPPPGVRRRRLLLGLAGATVTLAGAAGTTYALLDGDQSAGAAQRPSAAAVPEASLAWKKDLSNPCPQVFTAKDVVMGLGLQNVWGLTAGGDPKWTAASAGHRVSMASGTSPRQLGSVDGNRLYVGGSAIGTPLGAAVLAFDVASGDVVWKALLDRPASASAVLNWWGIRDGTAYLTVLEEDSARSVVAFDLAARKVRWARSVTALPLFAALPDGTGPFVFGTLDGLTALRAADGEQVWTRTARTGLVAAAGRHLVAGDQSMRLSGIDQATGKPGWTRTGIYSVVTLSPGVVTGADGSTLYALRPDGTTGRDFSLVALEPATGRIRWTAPLPTDAKPVGQAGARLLYGDGNVYRMDGSSVVWALDPANGRPRWKYTGMSSRAPMNLSWAAGNGRLCVTDAAAGTIATLNANGA